MTSTYFDGCNLLDRHILKQIGFNVYTIGINDKSG